MEHRCIPTNCYFAILSSLFCKLAEGESWFSSLFNLTQRKCKKGNMTKAGDYLNSFKCTFTNNND